MTTTLNPKLLDVVAIPAAGEGSRRERLTGTVVEVYGSEALLVEICDGNGIERDTVTVPANEAEVLWSSQARAPVATPVRSAQSQFEEAVLFLQNGLLTNARDKLGASFNLDPNLARGLLNSTVDLAARGAFDSAIVVLRIILELQPEYQLARENLARTHLNRGVRQAKRGFLDKALEDFTNALSVGGSPDVTSLARRNLAAGHTQIALKHVEIQRFEEAVHLFLMAFQLDPSPVTRKNFALALVSRSAWKEEGRSPVTDDSFREPMLMGLSLSECLNAYGATLARLGDLPRGREFLSRALETDPMNERARQNLELLSNGADLNVGSLSMWTVLETQAVQPTAQ